MTDRDPQTALRLLRGCPDDRKWPARVLLGVIMLGTAGNFMVSDMAKVRTSTTAMAEVRAGRKRGETAGSEVAGTSMTAARLSRPYHRF